MHINFIYIPLRTDLSDSEIKWMIVWPEQETVKTTAFVCFYD